MLVPSSLCFDLDCLHQPAIFAGEDEDLIILGDHCVPIARLCERRGRGAIGQGDHVGQRAGRLIVADDNQRCDEYHASDHCYGQHRDQSAQKAQVWWFYDRVFGSVVHV